MAKSGFLFHRKNRNLARALERELGQTVMLPWALGVCEALWDAIGKRRPRGDIGVMTDQAIADEIDWTGRADQLVRALVAAEILLEHPDYRLVASGWSEHCADWVRKRLQRSGESFWDSAPPFRRAAAEGPMEESPRPQQSPPPADHIQPAADHSQTLAHHDQPAAAGGGLRSRAVPCPAKTSQAKRKAGEAGGVSRRPPAPPARPPSLADSVDHDPDDPDQRRLAERLAGIEQQLADAEGRPPTPAGVRKVLATVSTTRRGGDVLDSLRKASTDWLAVTEACCAAFERSEDLRSPDELAERWISSRGGPSVVALAVRAWIAEHGRGEPPEVSLERWAMEPSDDSEVPSRVVEALLPYLRRTEPRAGLRAAG